MQLKHLLITRKSYYFKVFIVMLSFMSFYCGKASGQMPDYFINLKSDTVRCKLKVKYLTNDLLYKLTENSTYKPLSYDTLKEFYLHLIDRAYVPRVVSSDNRVTFLKRELSGRIDLFVLAVKTRHNCIYYYYASKNGGVCKELYNSDQSIDKALEKREEQGFSSLLSDYSELNSKFQKENRFFGFDVILDYIKQYDDYEAKTAQTSK